MDILEMNVNHFMNISDHKVRSPLYKIHFKQDKRKN